MLKIFSIVILVCFLVSCYREIIETPANKPVINNENWTTIWNNSKVDLITINFANNDTGYVITYIDSINSQSLLITYDGGKNWDEIIISQKVDSDLFTNIYPAGNKLIALKTYKKWHEKKWYGNYYNDLFISNDKGKHWTKSNFRTEGYTNIHIVDTGNFILNYHDPKGLYHSKNGLDWQNITNNIEDFNEINSLYMMYFVSKNVGYLITDSAIYKTTNGGTNWVKASKVPSLFARYYFFNDSIWYYSDIQGGFYESYYLYKTNNAGLSWSEIGQPPITLTLSYFEFDNARRYLHWFTGVNDYQFANQDIGYCFSRKKIYLTMDGGKTWVLDYVINEKPLYASFAVMNVLKSGIVYAITDCGRVLKRK